jgi:hypothetical protein
MHSQIHFRTAICLEEEVIKVKGAHCTFRIEILDEDGVIENEKSWE